MTEVEDEMVLFSFTNLFINWQLVFDLCTVCAYHSACLLGQTTASTIVCCPMKTC
jgi:hypothetical protein